MPTPRPVPLLRWCAMLLLLGSGPIHAQLINVLGNNTTIPANDTTPSFTDHTNFGGVAVLGGFIDRIFTIRNVGASPLSILGIQRIGGQRLEFTIPIAPAVLLPGESETDFVVRFNPGLDGERSTILRIHSNSSSNPTFDFKIQGEGLVPAPEINVQGNGLDIMDGDPVPRVEDHTDFESVDVGAGGITRTFTIQNLGQERLTIPTLEFIGGSSDQFTFTRLQATTVDPGQETSFEVTFNPSITGLHLTTIRINNTDVSESTYDFAIRGDATTTSPKLTLLGNNMVIEAGDDTPSSDDHTKFESTDLNAISTRIFTIQNTGTAPLSIATIVMVGGHAADFSSSPPPTNSIAPGGSATVQVTFSPSALGVRTTTLRLNSNDSATPVFEVDLLGTGGSFELLRIERNGNDAIIVFNSNPDTAVTTYIYSIRYGTDLDTWNTIGSFLSPGGRTEQFRHVGGFIGESGFWYVAETVIP